MLHINKVAFTSQPPVVLKCFVASVWQILVADEALTSDAWI
jgi:hypothetical protein